ncbi:MAG: phenylalanine--tRNA ligase subunit beta [Gemmatimonadetes bacterium 13_1_40CM_4_69_8]|nr:MAG: phenylalanine--tRNA ligase subunit beta [Gemmatimonadetes bacterium 13_1_40CM_4_69_8]
MEVVCGAPNVQAGKLYPYAPVGALLPGGMRLERKQIRGVVSNGMLCSAKELGLGGDHSGILELDTAAAPGTRFVDAVPVDDHQIVIDVPASRPDLLCHKGVARELAALLGGVVKLPQIPGAQSLTTRPPDRQAARGSVDGVDVRLEDPEGCPRYMAAVIRGVRVGPSPAWLADRLRAIGQRPINNVVDATNYVLFELNQPLHAFDVAQLRGPAVVIRRAQPQEKIVTLDGVERTLTPDMTAICDAARPTIVAGVMGSAQSEVTASTTDLVLECAYFQPTRIRRTRRALELSSESSYRFERGLDLLGMPDALRRAIELIVAVAGGELRAPPLDLWPQPVQEKTIFLRPERVSHLLGVAIERAELERLLTSVGFFVAPKDGRLAVQVPGWRPDVTREVDLIEEIARLTGYDAFPDELRPYRPGTVPDAPVEQAKARVRQQLVRAGLSEARTIPLGPPDGPHAVAIRNPMSADEAHLRRRLLPGLVRRVEHNWANRNRDIRLFEVGTVFRATQQAPEEWDSVAGVLTGARRPPHWSEGAKVPDMDIWDLKHHFELAVNVAAPTCAVQPATEGVGGWVAVERGGEVVGEARALEADAPVWAAPLFGFEVRLLVTVPEAARYRPLPTQPPVERDVALLLPAGVSAAAVSAVLARATGPLLARLDVFDEYRGSGVPAGHRSVAWHCTFRDPSRTLREREVDELLARALQALEDELGVRRREG